MPDLELEVIRFLGHSLPRVPHASGIVNRFLKHIYLRKPRPPLVCDVLGVQMALNPEEGVDANLIFCPQLYDYPEIAYLIAHLGPDDTFVDIGAHVGFYALMATKRICTGRVVAIEAAPQTFATLKRNIEMNDLPITALHCGVSDREETLELYLQGSGNCGGSSFMARPYGGHLGGRSERVPCYPLLDVLSHAGVTRVTGMKLDIEGFEYKVLKHFFDHATPELWPEFVITEYFEAWVADTTGDQVRLLTDLGYHEVQRTKNNRILVRAGAIMPRGAAS
jgi:FkbM family methyltransferase